MSIDELNDFLDKYEDDNFGMEYYTLEDFREAVEYLHLTYDDGSAVYIVDGDSTSINAFVCPPPSGATGVLWYNK